MPEKTPGGPLPSQTGTTQKGAPAPGKGTAPASAPPVDKSGKQKK
jgi:hypothetical protein